ncbi:PTS mannitol transporter subunit IIA [Oenococcus oeni]|uniref:PTS sugar transporter subunit IIA n=3 Tax=Oenococcus oeni TaxID=1247 RepID=UPI000BDF6BCD|nr:PTS sugar transporter subunit IIA [Oenococcus oeni]PDH77526.1 PTS mannitol transporter subunit IIA [Oenococcus oeni]PDH87031.1 PTS mannitol transporter subunit IIA [Oenococcus oeni]PDH89324.1 PTS mannitol transporter subunit IIA [Oenococcus oeni]PDH89574.1 PTS mannitol transporter subunit IIA [Oenococcus oeni]PDH91500.1 PTS mannitol transporter subunit IIA [Oenococcus oeni]
MDIKKETVLLDQQVTTKKEAIQLAGQLLVKNDYAQPEYIDSMLERETDLSTYMGNFIAIPHGTDDGRKYINKTGISIVQIPMGVNFSSNNESENIVTIVFGIAGLNGEHLDLLSQISIFCSDVNNVVKLADAQSKEEIINLLKEVNSK